jgi:hypothetical protein
MIVHRPLKASQKAFGFSNALVAQTHLENEDE